MENKLLEELNKKELEERQELKGCYGTKEFSEVGICKACRLQNDCRKVENKKKSKTVIIKDNSRSL